MPFKIVMLSRLQRLIALLRSGERAGDAEVPALADESRWYTEHTALLISTLKWACLGAGAGVCVGLSTRGFLWTIGWSGDMVRAMTQGAVPPYVFLPLALPLCVMLIRLAAPDARGHGTEAVISAVHQQSGRINWRVAPVKLVATILTLAFGGSVGKEGPAAQIGAAFTSLTADVFRLSDHDRRRLVICGISAGFAAVFGTPVSGALFGIEVLYLGALDYTLIFPALVAGIVAHLACGVQPPFPVLETTFQESGQATVVISIVAGACFGLVALLLIETLRFMQRVARRFERRPMLLAFGGGVLLAALFYAVGDSYAGLGTPTIDAALSGTAHVALFAFLFKIIATGITLESGGSGGIITPVFFIGATSGAAFGQLAGFSPAGFAAFGFVSVLAAAANTPIAAAVMAIELLPRPEAVYAALAAVTAFLLVGHRSVYASQKLGVSKSGGLDLQLGNTMGEFDVSTIRVREGTLAARLHRYTSRKHDEDGPDDS